MLESLDLPLGVVLGTFGVERHRITWRGQAAHAGSTPMDQRRDALAGAAKLALELREIAARVGDGAVLHERRRRLQAGDRHLGRRDRRAAARPCATSTRQARRDVGAGARGVSSASRAEESLEVEFEKIWSIEPILFDETLIGFADEAIREVAGTSHRLPSGPLHDAAEVSRAGVPTVMLFVQSLRGLSHTKLEDTKPEHLELSVQALDRRDEDARERVALASRRAPRGSGRPDAGRDERHPEQPARRDRVLVEADPAEVVDGERGDRLAGEDEGEEGRRAELRRVTTEPRT